MSEQWSTRDVDGDGDDDDDHLPGDGRDERDGKDGRERRWESHTQP